MKVEIRNGQVWAMAETKQEMSAFLLGTVETPKNGHKTGYRVWKCEKCDFVGKGKRGLNIHELRTHSDRPWKNNWATRDKWFKPKAE